MEPEGGVTGISLRNAEELIHQYGRPIRVTCYQEGWEQFIKADFIADSIPSSHVFSGFSWGYGGEGPHGLAKFFKMIGVSYTVEAIASWAQEGLNLVLVLGEDY